MAVLGTAALLLSISLGMATSAPAVTTGPAAHTASSVPFQPGRLISSSLVSLHGLNGLCVSYTGPRSGDANHVLIEVPCRQSLAWILMNYTNGSQLRADFNQRLSLGNFAGKIVLMPTSDAYDTFMGVVGGAFNFMGVAYYHSLFTHATGTGQYFQWRGLNRVLTTWHVANYNSYFAYVGCTSTCRPDENGA